MSLIKNYLHQLQTMNRDQLQHDYIESIIDGMDHKDLWAFVYDALEQNLESYSDEELVTEVKDYYPHLLEEETDFGALEATADDYGVGK
jgi:site-specific recombinase XerD